MNNKSAICAFIAFPSENNKLFNYDRKVTSMMYSYSIVTIVLSFTL